MAAWVSSNRVALSASLSDATDSRITEFAATNSRAVLAESKRCAAVAITELNTSSLERVKNVRTQLSTRLDEIDGRLEKLDVAIKDLSLWPRRRSGGVG